MNNLNFKKFRINSFTVLLDREAFPMHVMLPEHFRNETNCHNRKIPHPHTSSWMRVVAATVGFVFSL